MRATEEGFLLLSCTLGDPERRILTTPQLRTLALRVSAMEKPLADRELRETDLADLGYSADMAIRIVSLLSEEQRLHHYLRRGQQKGCIPLTRVSEAYPQVIRQRLGTESPGVLWAKGDLSFLKEKKVSLVGSRNIEAENAEFAAKVGTEAARQGYVLISGNARGADRIAQEACLKAGGRVLAVVADELEKQKAHPQILYLSEEGFDTAFSSLRALSRNRVIHALGDKVFVAQCYAGKGGTWSGTVKNLKGNWSPVFCYQNGSESAAQLIRLGAVPISLSALENLDSLQESQVSLF